MSVLDKLPDGVPCKHPGCLSHISHSCDGCGRVGGITSKSVLERIRSGELQLCEDMAGFGEELWCQREEETAEVLAKAELGERMQWVPISEGLPEDGQKVDCFTQSTMQQGREIDCIYLAKEGFTWGDDYYTIVENVTHWMPTLEPPKEGTSNE